MRWALNKDKINEKVVDEVARHSGQNIRACYQCGKCVAGCPISEEMDFAPNQIMRLLQLGLIDKALSSHTIWLCASCYTCSARCPQKIDLARVMEQLRIMAQRDLNEEDASFTTLLKGFGLRMRDAFMYLLQMDIKSNNRCFSELFLKSVRYYGRLFETGLIYNYNINSGNLFGNFLKAPIMLLRSKIGFIPQEIKRIEKVEKIFKGVEGLQKIKENEQ
ncbi:MAG: 4Fe-4S dicluster domain-containing protein [bacterium]